MKNIFDYGYDGYGYFNPFFDGYDGFFNPFSLIGKDDAPLRTDIIERENEYVLNVEVQVESRERLNVEVENGYLTVTAKRGDDNTKCDDGCEKSTVSDKENCKYLRRERRVEQVSRSYYVGNVDESEVKAKYSDGLLVITIPKKAKRIERKKIEIENQG